MNAYVFKVTRRVDGKPQKSPSWYAALRMPWETKERRWCLETSDKREAERRLHEERIRCEKEHNHVLPPRPQQEAAERPLDLLLAAYLTDLQAEGRAVGTIKKYRNLGVQFGRIGWKRIADVTARSFCDWRPASGLEPRTLNAVLKDTGTFFGWLRRNRMAGENPLEFVRPVETRRLEKFRRAFSEDELRRLVTAASHECGITYLAAYYTGLRRNELYQVTVADLVLESPAPFVRVRASTAKVPKEHCQRIPPDFVPLLRSIIPDDALPWHHVFAGKIPRIPRFKRDLDQAGIPFEDELGRRTDFHALRDTLGTHLAAVGTPPFVLKEIMRHSTIQQTEKYYIDARQLPVAPALALLPKFSWEREAAIAPG